MFKLLKFFSSFHCAWLCRTTPGCELFLPEPLGNGNRAYLCGPSSMLDYQQHCSNIDLSQRTDVYLVADLLPTSPLHSCKFSDHAQLSNVMANT